MSIERALEVLCCFSSEKPEWGISELSQYLGLYKSTVHRFLDKFEHVGLVERTPAHRYRLGVRALELGNVFRLNQSLLEAAERPLRDLAETTDSIARLARMDGRDVFVMLRTTGAHPKPFTRHAMLRMPAHCTALGKVLLADGTADDFRRFVGVRTSLKRLTSRTITDPEELGAHLREVAAAGFALDNEEAALGQRCLAVPVFDARSGRAIAAISISASRDRFDDPHIPALVRRMAATSKAISKALKQASNPEALL